MSARRLVQWIILAVALAMVVAGFVMGWTDGGAA